MNFQLHRLGWKDFQHLCLAIARRVLGQTVASFLDANDGGRDGAFEGQWSPQCGQTFSGHFVIQCKHTSKADHNLGLSDLKDELSKCRRLASKDLCHVYVLITNAGLSGKAEEAIRGEFLNAGVHSFLCFGSTWISDQIREHKDLRMDVPRLYGLGDLTQIMDERAYSQAKALLASLQEDLSKVVLTSTYHRAAEALQKHSFVLLLGEPAAGKTTIAATLSMASIDLWNCSTIKLEEPAQVADRWNPDEPSQFFWVDDAFGATQYESWLAYRWNGVFPKIQAALKRGAKIVMTSRDYIYNRARQDLKISAFPLLSESKIVIDVKDLSLAEKQQILYNHIKLGNQPASFRRKVKPFLDSISRNEAYVPEVARRLGNSSFTAQLGLTSDSLRIFVEKREEHLLEVITGLDPASKAALALIFMRDGKLGSPLALIPDEHEALSRLDSTLGAATRALEALTDSFVRYVVIGDESCWIFKHPTIADALAIYLASSQELMGIYLRGTPVDKLLGQVTCGDVGVRGAIVIQPGFFDTVIGRLAKAKDREIERVHRFLTGRCSKQFLRVYCSQCPDLLEGIAEPGLCLAGVSETDLAIHLHKLGLLPEKIRYRFAKAAIAYTVDGDDGYILRHKPLRSMLTCAEESELVRRLEAELIPNLGAVRRTWQSNARYGDREQSVYELIALLDSLAKEFSGEATIVAEVHQQTGYLNEWIAEDETPEPRVPEREQLSEVDPQWSERRAEARSIFEDVDL